MKKLLLITSLLIVGKCALAQKLLKPEIDVITGDTTLSTSYETVFLSRKWYGSGVGLRVAARKFKGVTFLSFRIGIVNGAHSEVYRIDKGSKAIFKLNDGSLVTLSAISDQMSDTKVGSTGMGTLSSVETSSVMFISYSGEPDEYKKLTDNNIKVIRLETSKENFDFEIQDKNQGLIAKELAILTKGK